MNLQIDLSEFFELRKSLPVVDVRSEGEFQAGHIAGSVNLPLLNDDDRKVVGTLYKQEGQAAAIREGFNRVGPKLVTLMDQAADIGREMIVHCWRGGMRSGNFAAFAQMARIKPYVLQGGYKAYRTQALEWFTYPFRFFQIGGSTGSGKTELLHHLAAQGEQVLDLEGLARHKGSAFGHLGQPAQPTTEQFQNDLFEALHLMDRSRPIWIEDESFSIGQVLLPEPFWRKMSASPLVEIIVPQEVRVQRLVQEYGTAPREEFIACISRIQKKLGGLNTQLSIAACQEGRMAEAITYLLSYYDRTYSQGLQRRKSRIALQISCAGSNFDKTAKELMDWSAAYKFSQA